VERPLTPHDLLNPGELAPPVGFSHAVVAAPGRTVYIGGQAGHDPDGKLPAGGLVEHFDWACAGVVAALAAAGARPVDLVQVHIYTKDANEYRARLEDLGAVWRRHFGTHYPAVSLFGVSGFFDPNARVEVTAVAVVPDT
jgi:enamine deaminase RidA (YjgF/YER057c/UK114 family)